MAVRRRFGHQIVRGITTDPGAFSQISVRRIVDYAKAGVRLGSNPYIGKLNNARVRAALKATLDGFLSQMVLDEMLTGYELEVTATRAQEIRGIAIVTMTLQPTFSIDFIRVTMNLRVRGSPRCPTAMSSPASTVRSPSPSRPASRATPPRPSTTPTA